MRIPRGSVLHILLCFLTGFPPGEAGARVYRIRKGEHFADGTLNVNQWFIGKKLRFQARFDPSNAYTLPPGDQADSNKLFGFSDCGQYAGNSSARIGWRWYRNRLEITAVAHYEGTWHLHEILGIADFNRIHDFEIELSPDRAHYRFRYDQGPPVEMKRDCDSPILWGYVLYPYFGGNLPAPHDMQVSVWSEARAGISLLQAGPNPVIPSTATATGTAADGQLMRTRIFAPETIRARYEILSPDGSLEWASPASIHPGTPEPVEDSFVFPRHLPSGIHLLRLSSWKEGRWIPGFILDGEEALRILVLN